MKQHNRSGLWRSKLVGQTLFFHAIHFVRFGGQFLKLLRAVKPNSYGETFLFLVIISCFFAAFFSPFSWIYCMKKCLNNTVELVDIFRDNSFSPCAFATKDNAIPITENTFPNSHKSFGFQEYEKNKQNAQNSFLQLY